MDTLLSLVLYVFTAVFIAIVMAQVAYTAFSVLGLLLSRSVAQGREYLATAFPKRSSTEVER